MPERSYALERRILDLTSRLVKLVVYMSDEKNAGTDQREEGLLLVKEMSRLLMPIIDGKTEHLKPVISQICNQKLPPKSVLSSFGSFYDNLEELIASGVKRFTEELDKEEDKEIINEISSEDSSASLQEEAPLKLQESEEEPEPPVETVEDELPEKEAEEKASVCYKAGYTESASPDLVERILNLLYGTGEVYAAYNLFGLKLQYYVPRARLAVEISRSLDRRRELLCRARGLKLKHISPEEVCCASSIMRKLRNND